MPTMQTMFLPLGLAKASTTLVVALKLSQSNCTQNMCAETIRQSYKLPSHQVLNHVLQLLVL